MTFGRRLIWLSILALLMQMGLGVAWLATLSVNIGQLTVKHPELQKIFEQVQAQQSLTPLTPSSSDAERILEAMMPIFSQLDWHGIALFCSFFSFGMLGFAYARITGSIDYLGCLPVLALLSGQNPIILALEMSQQGVVQAAFSHPFELGLLALQLASVYGFGLLGQRLYQRNAPAGATVTPR
ncbi:MAG: hypothetical protein U0931_12495 [Vulcanimicrobiota bacterium]